MTLYLIISSILALCLFSFAVMVLKLRRQPTEHLSLTQYLKLGTSGVLAFIADTVGVGSFACNVALAKLFGTFRDEELPAVNNGAQVLPGAIESIFFVKLVDVDLTTLIVLVLGTCVGGLLGGFVVSKLGKQTIRLTMVCSFAVIIFLLISHQLQWLPVGGDLTALNSWQLVIGFFAMMVCGALTSAGIGLFVMVQGVLFLMNISPLVAFPIMTTAGAMQQSLTTLVFLKNDKIPLKKTIVLSLAGCVGVLITLPFFTQLTINGLHLFLLGILIYNFCAVGNSYLRSRPVKSYSQQRSNLIAAD